MRPSKTRSPATVATIARAGRNIQAEPINSDPQRILQAQRLRAWFNCTEEVAGILARLIYGEGRA
jgi:hypothetical protein